MRRVLAVAVLLLLVSPAWSFSWKVDYPGSSDAYLFGWTRYSGNYLGSSVSDLGLTSWYFDDNLSTDLARLKWTGTPAVTISPDTGATVESKLRCELYVANGAVDPLTLGLYVAWTEGGAQKIVHWVSIMKTEMTMKGHKCVPDSAVPYLSVPGWNSNNYNTIRLCYKRQNLDSRGPVHTWATYVNASTDPIIHSWASDAESPSNISSTSPIWGPGSRLALQQVYYSTVKCADSGAYPPGYDSSGTFTKDPDGAFAPDGQSIIVTWSTSVPTTGEVHYGVEDTTKVTKYNRIAYDSYNPTLRTVHNITLTQIEGQVTGFYVISTDETGKKMISLPNIVTSPFFVSVGPSCTVAPSKTSATITWTTSDLDTHSEVHWGTDASCPNVTEEVPAGGKASHSVVISPLATDTIYYYYVKSYGSYPPCQKNGSPFNTYTALVPNGGFETAGSSRYEAPPWVRVGGRVPSQMNFGQCTQGDGPTFSYSAPAHTGDCLWQIAEQGGQEKDHAYAYQQFDTTAGNWYLAKAWIWTRRQAAMGGHESTALDVACRIGIDPTGMVIPGEFIGDTYYDYATAQWSGWYESDDACTDQPNPDGSPRCTGGGGPWKQIAVYCKATGTEPTSTSTLFIQGREVWALDMAVADFDDVTFEQFVPPSTIGGARQCADGCPVDLSNKRVIAVFADPNDPPQQKNSNFYIEESNRSAGIRVHVANNSLLPVVGELVRVTGVMATDNSRAQFSRGGERYIAADGVVRSTAGPGDPEMPKPVGMKNNALVDGPTQPVIAETDPPHQVGGACTQGLLTKIWGRVLADPDFPSRAEFPPNVDPGFPDSDLYGRYKMYVDDGSGVLADYRLFQNFENRWYNNGQYTGVKVYYPVDPDYPWNSYRAQTGDYALCTGVAGVEATYSTWSDPFGDIKYIRTLHVLNNVKQNTPEPPLDYTDIIVWRGF